MAKKTAPKVKKAPPKTGGAGSSGKKPFPTMGLGKLKGSTDGKERRKRLDDEIKRQGG